MVAGIGATGLLLLSLLPGGEMSMRDAPPLSTGVVETAGDPAPALQRVRALYLAAVGDESAIDDGMREIERVRSWLEDPEGGRVDETLTAYRGALVTLRAKHALWPPNKLRHLREGLEILDGSVAASPQVAEIRYLRLMSCFYLPSVLGRKESVREDFAALARLLPGARAEYPEEAYRAIVTFVLEEGNPGPEQRVRLESALAAADG